MRSKSNTYLFGDIFGSFLGRFYFEWRLPGNLISKNIISFCWRIVVWSGLHTFSADINRHIFKTFSTTHTFKSKSSLGLLAILVGGLHETTSLITVGFFELRGGSNIFLFLVLTFSSFLRSIFSVMSYFQIFLHSF